VLLSADTQRLARDVPAFSEFGVELRDLGEHWFEHPRHSERIFQLVVPNPVEDPPSPEPPNPASQERYDLRKLIGSGGMGEVYLAHDRLLERDVALKVLKNWYADDEQFVERFEREARSAASLSHPNIVSVFDRGEAEDHSYYIVMEHVPGGDLKEHILKEGPLQADEAVVMALQMARALSHAHECGVIHRDVKPQNVLLTGTGEAKVADFGIARAVAASTVTKTGFIVGTPHYISPEQALGHPATPKSDLYSLGVVLYEMLTGEVPHDAETPVGTVTKHISGHLRPPLEVNPEVPEKLDAVVVRLLARDPEDRYPDVAGLIEDLERMLPEEPLALAVGRQQVSSTAHLSVVPDPPTATPPLKAESEGERYSLKELIGSGGMAEVYLAHDLLLGREVAFKKLRQQYAQDEEVVERFGREARNVASLSHPNIVRVYDRGETDDGTYYMVMEYVPGGTLKERILKEGLFSLDEAAAIALQVARALRAAHEREVIHRDVKPQNVLLAGLGRAKVADFGIARAAAASTLTKAGSIMGTAHYLSPEQALGHPASPKSDLYSLGVVLYEMLTGELPYDAETPFGILMEHVSGELRPPNEVNPEVPEGLNAVVVRLLAQDLDDRYRDAAELIEDLERVRRVKPATQVEQHEATSPAPTTPQVEHEKGKGRRGWRWFTIPLLLLLLALAGGAVYALFPGTTRGNLRRRRRHPGRGRTQCRRREARGGRTDPPGGGLRGRGRVRGEF
jgi:serine/threonine protein kinase